MCVFDLQEDHQNIQMKIDKYQNYFKEKELEVSFWFNQWYEFKCLHIWVKGWLDSFPQRRKWEWKKKKDLTR